jgi:hypothetical protein
MRNAAPGHNESYFVTKGNQRFLALYVAARNTKLETATEINLNLVQKCLRHVGVKTDFHPWWLSDGCFQLG